MTDMTACVGCEGMKEEFVIEARNISKEYLMGSSHVHALDRVSLGLRQGEFISITGPSGSGKTTLLNVFSALLRPSSGEVYINKKPISRMNDSELARVRGKTIGFVFQTFNLIPRLTALENVMLPMWFQGIPVETRLSHASKVLHEVGLGDRVNHKPSELSGGQRQRVAIARALAVDPDVIVADEPTGNLDSKSGAVILNMISALHEEKGKTVLVVTHERYVAERAQRIIHMKDGRIEKTEEVRKRSKGMQEDYK